MHKNIQKVACSILHVLLYNLMTIILCIFFDEIFMNCSQTIDETCVHEHGGF